MRKKIIHIVSILIMSNIIFAQSDDFVLSTKQLQSYSPTFVGNGYFSLSSSRLATLPAESYMIKVYDHGKNDIPRIACLPAWNEINYYNGNKWLNDSNRDSTQIDPNQFQDYQQTLDMYDGILQTSYKWGDEARRTDISIQSFVSRKNKNLAVIRFEFTPDFSDSVRLSFPLQEKEQPKRMALAKLEKLEQDPPGSWPRAWYPGFIKMLKINSTTEGNKGFIQALSQSDGRNTKVALSVGVISKDNIPNLKISSSGKGNSASIEVRFMSEKGKKYTFYKIAGIASDIIEKGDIQKKAADVCRTALNTDYDNLLSEHKSEWNNLWNTDIIVDGDMEFQKLIHSMMYYLLCSVDSNTNFSIPPMGLSSCGYYGHIFWDADTYMFPPMLLMHPAMAKSMVMFRESTLKAAMENARKNNYKGAMYPWESDEIGNETTPYFAIQNALRENHIVGDVALAQWQYFLATKDMAWLREYGSKVITATADFWTSRVSYNKQKDRYDIGKIVSVSESQKDVSNETYTNSIAKINLELASKVCDILKLNKNPEWNKISTKLFIPYDEKDQYHPIYENAPSGTKESTEFWTSVAPLLSYPLQMDMSQIAKRNDLLNAVRGLEEVGAGANMGSNFLPIIAAELGNDSLFNLTIEKTYKGYLRPPFNVLAETHNNKSINFITGAGAFLQQVIFGYTGLRISEKGLEQKYKPMLPKNITSLKLKNFTMDNQLYDITVEGNKLTMKKIQ